MPDEKLQVLVVDDELDVGEFLSRVLKSLGHEVTAATSAPEAIQLLGARKFDLVISDWRMPGYLGSELYEQIALNWPALLQRFLLVTGDIYGDDISAFLDRTHVPYLNKPCRAADVREAVERVLEATRS
ncbi:MAG: response regulator [Candidatus Wallbacteria bacterium]|nr:response regulator [Candidatus Wallbacteria bacterium]